MKIISSKSTLLLGGLISFSILITPMFLITSSLQAQSSLTPDDFFIRLIENKADLTWGYAVYEIKNPTGIDIVIDNSILKTRIVNQEEATLTTSLKTFILKTVDYSEKVTDYSYECNPFNITNVNGTYTVDNCTTVVSGWHWNNYTKDEWHELGSEIFKLGNVYKIKIEATWLPKIGLNSREWFPQINIEGKTYEQTKWSWWNSSWSYYKNITITNPSSIARTLEPIEVVFTHNNRLMSSCNDIRVVSDLGSELDIMTNATLAKLTNSTMICDSTHAEVQFRANTSASSSVTYSIYYGNQNATPPINNQFVATHWYNNYSGSSPPNWINGTDLQASKGTSDAPWTATYPTPSTIRITRTSTTNTYAILKSNSTITALTFNATYMITSLSPADDAWCPQTNLYKDPLNYWQFDRCGPNGGSGQRYERLVKFVNGAGTVVWSGTGSGALAMGPGEYTIAKMNATGWNFYRNGTFLTSQTLDLGNSFFLTIENYGNNNGGFVEFNYTVAGAFYYDPPSTYSIGAEETSEKGARQAIREGIWDSLGQSAPLYYDQQVYARILNNGSLVKFDIVTFNASKRWGFNFVNLSETYSFSYNVTPSFYNLQINHTEGLSAEQIRNKVSSLINETKG